MSRTFSFFSSSPSSFRSFTKQHLPSQRDQKLPPRVPTLPSPWCVVFRVFTCATANSLVLSFSLVPNSLSSRKRRQKKFAYGVWVTPRCPSQLTAYARSSRSDTLLPTLSGMPKKKISIALAPESDFVASFYVALLKGRRTTFSCLGLGLLFPSTQNRTLLQLILPPGETHRALPP